MRAALQAARPALGKKLVTRRRRRVQHAVVHGPKLARAIVRANRTHRRVRRFAFAAL